jgi:phosphate transport system substrate-binding protein
MIVAFAFLMLVDGMTHRTLSAERLTVGGTGAALAAMRQIGDAFEQAHPEIIVDILPSLGSRGSIKALLAGSIDIALTARPLRESETERGIRGELYARTPVVLATSRYNSVTGLTVQELTEILTGERTTWENGRTIGLVMRPIHSAHNRILMTGYPELETAVEQATQRPGVPIAYTVQEAAEMIEVHPGGLGIADLSVILGENRRLKALALDGVSPTIQSVLDGDYRLVKSFYLVTAEEPGGPVMEFQAFLRSDDALEMLRSTGNLTVEGQ